MIKTWNENLSRQRFFEVKQVMEDYNNDLISFTDFKQLISPEEAESYEYMLRRSGFNISKVHFNEPTD